MRYAAVVPAIRTIPGVDVFDYLIPEGIDIAAGDLVPIRFRNQRLPGLVLETRGTSDVAAKAKPLDGAPIVRLGPAAAVLLRRAAERTFSALPTVLGAWLGHLPLRAWDMDGKETVDARPSSGPDAGAPRLHVSPERWDADDGIAAAVRAASGRRVVLVPWRHRAERLAARVGGNFLHGDLADGAAWEALKGFFLDPEAVIVTTRRGAWLASLADAAFVDEPENDDHKQEELAPRLDARWTVAMAKLLRPALVVHAFAVTPRLQAAAPPPAADLSEVEIVADAWKRSGHSDVPELSAHVFELVQEAADAGRPVLIVHPIEGDLSRIACRDCGWNAACSACAFSLSVRDRRAKCRSCGRTDEIPEACPKCGGTDLGKGRVGIDRLTEAVHRAWPDAAIRVRSPMAADAEGVAPGDLVVVTDLARIGGGVEDIRRNERLAIAWRRVCAMARQASALVVQGPEDLLEKASAWLGPDGLAALWAAELADRAAFGYPPAAWTIKFLADGEMPFAESLVSRLKKAIPPTWSVRGPHPVAHRASTRKTRHAIHLLPGPNTSEAEVRAHLARFARDGYIDLDPIAFFC
jgi:primosomal protein N'